MVRQAMTNVKTTGRLAFVAVVILSAPLCQATDSKPDYYCEYIESTQQNATPSPWIDTGIKATPLTRLSVDLAFGSLKNASQIGIFGLHYNVTPKFCFIAYIGDGDLKNIDFKYVDGYWNTSSVSSYDLRGSRMTITMDGVAKNFSITSNNIDGTVETLCSKSMNGVHSWPDDFASEHSIPLFNRYNSSGSTTNLHNRSLCAKLYGCTIATNGVMVRNFKPAVSGGVAGLWDEVECRFYASASEKAFTAGPKLKLGGMRIIFR